MQNQPLAIFLMGPTASGKTDLAVALTKALPCDIISVDSALIYRTMNIGTAKPDAQTLTQAPHRLIDILEPTESYSVARFYHDALYEMQAISASGRIPLLVGGTMMYFRTLREGIAALPSADKQIRERILADAEDQGWAYVHAQLAEVDPESARRLKPTDSQRIQRALEVYRISGRTMTESWADQKSEGLKPIPYNIVSLGLVPKERIDLHERIATRFRQMLAQGFVEEVERFYRSGKVDAGMPSMRCVGYRQVWEYLEGNLDYEEMIERGIIATRQLAKRQLTWLRAWPNLNWLETDDTNILAKALKIVQNAASKEI